MSVSILTIAGHPMGVVMLTYTQLAYFFALSRTRGLRPGGTRPRSEELPRTAAQILSESAMAAVWTAGYQRLWSGSSRVAALVVLASLGLAIC